MTIGTRTMPAIRPAPDDEKTLARKRATARDMVISAGFLSSVGLTLGVWSLYMLSLGAHSEMALLFGVLGASLSVSLLEASAVLVLVAHTRYKRRGFLLLGILLQVAVVGLVGVSFHFCYW